MRLSTTLHRAVAVSAVAALGFTLLPARSPADSRTGQAAPTAQARFLPQAAQPFPPPGRSGAAPRGTRPNSTLPVTPTNDCSVETATPGPACSTLAGVVACSTQCESGGVCSVRAALAGEGFCSTVQRATGCSVLQPSLHITLGFCSATHAPAGFASYCSTLTVQESQACSAENPGGTLTRCSAFGANISHGEIYCSVLATGGQKRRFCSTFRSGDKRCSVEFALPDGTTTGGCSIAIGATGVCTALKQAPSGSCSVLMGGVGHCSVIHGPGPRPNGRCVQ